MKRAIRNHLRDFIAILALATLGLTAGFVILAQQRVSLPTWVPLLGQDRFELQGEFTSGQAIVPGQGQTVTIAGVKVGDVGGVELSNGRALVTLEIDPKYAPLIRSDTTMVLRPRTGLQDMTVELNLGRKGHPVAEDDVIPLSQTVSPVQSDQILASLDADTRSYLKLLLAGGAQGLGGHGPELSAGLRRIEPTTRDLAEISGALAKRSANIRGAIHNFRLLSDALGSRDAQLSRFVTASNAVLGDFADQQAALQASLERLPGTLRATRDALDSAKILGLTAGPALQALTPSAAALGPALREVRPLFVNTTSTLHDQIRPFTRQVRQPVRHLAQLAPPLGAATTALAGGTTELNSLLNAIAYNPPGPEEGYLFWAAWLNHTTNSLFLNQDAGGPLRRGMVLLSCQTAGLAEGIASTRPFLKTLQEATRIPTSDEICPLDPITF